MLAVAAWIRQLRLRVLRGEEARLDDPPVLTVTDSCWRRAIEPLFRAASALLAPGSISASERQKGSLLAADWSTGPVYTSFALRATLATMGSYVFMTLTDWTEIHTCMITCVVTALVVAEERERKQTLRLVGVILGGLYGLLAVVFFIPQFDSLMGLLIVLGVGTAMAAWLSTGPKRNSYSGWQMGLALYMTIVQKPHPVTELDVIWDRFVGIVVGVVAMRLAFAFPASHLAQKVQPWTPMTWALMQTIGRHHDSRHGVSNALLKSKDQSGISTICSRSVGFRHFPMHRYPRDHARK